jgi:AcrR family transcriptional regulator
MAVASRSRRLTGLRVEGAASQGAARGTHSAEGWEASPGEASPEVLDGDASARTCGVGDFQRARIIAAMSELVRERGIGGVTVAHVVGRSGVSRRTFYELFDDRDGCLLATFDQAIERVAAVVIPAYEQRDARTSWQEQIRAALSALLRFLDDEPALGGLLVVDALAGEHRILARRARVVTVLVDAVQGGARKKARQPGAPAGRGDGDEAQPASRPRRIVAEGVVGAVLAVLHARLLEPSPGPLSALLNSLMGIVVLPYLGPAAAQREFERPRPRARRRPPLPVDPLRGLDMRLTYRTVRVLQAIAELGLQGSNPSGRQVADAAGVADQGQMSKLLARLRQLGLIENSAGGRGKGEPNAWTLTARGCEVERAIRAQTES